MMFTPAKTRVIVVDDHQLVRESLTRIVAAQPDMAVVAEAADGPQAINAICEQAPAVVLMDVSIPGSSGVTLTAQLSQEHPSVRVIGVSRHNEAAVMDAMLQAGAQGYVLKQNAALRLPAAIRAVAGGAKYVDAALGPGKLPQRGPSPEASEVTVEETLNALEEDVLRLVAFSYTHEQIATCLGIDVDATMNLKAAAMQKAHLASRIQVMTYARARGWLSKQSHRLAVHGRHQE